MQDSWDPLRCITQNPTPLSPQTLKPNTLLSTLYVYTLQSIFSTLVNGHVFDIKDFTKLPEGPLCPHLGGPLAREKLTVTRMYTLVQQCHPKAKCPPSAIVASSLRAALFFYSRKRTVLRGEIWGYGHMSGLGI